MKIYTKTGDKGMTSLFGGKRVWKDNLRIESYGSVDEVNSFIGLALCEIDDPETKRVLQNIQNELFLVGADLATPRSNDKVGVNIERISNKHLKKIEKLIDEFSDRLPELKHFILPGGTKGASILHIARTVCRRAERNIIALTKVEDVGNDLVVYTNRLSDFLFVLARYVNYLSNTPDVKWEKN